MDVQASRIGPAVRATDTRESRPADDLPALLADHARAVAADLAGRPGVRAIPTPDFVARARADGTLTKPVIWDNAIFTGPQFRWAHVEYFAIPGQFAVVHICILPWLDRHRPIFGFDIVVGVKKATGAFLDLSPTTAPAAAITAAWAATTASRRAAFGDRRDLPAWATAIFSPHALAVRPNSAEDVDAVLLLGARSLALMLERPAVIGPAAAMAEAQIRYAAGQRQNPHTFKMLTNCVGSELAREFIDEWLFPLPQ